MFSSRVRLVVCGIMLLVISAVCMSTAMAAPSLDWRTESVYFDRAGNLILDGYYYNNGSNIVWWVNWQKINVYFKQPNSVWWHHATGLFRDMNLYLRPGESKRYTLRIRNVNYAHFQFWRTDGDINYQYK